MSSLKTLAQKAKYRLRMVSNEEKDEDKTYQEACLSAKVQYAIIASQKKVEDDPIYNKVKSILTKDIDTTSPLSKLIDNTHFSSLDASKQERYLFGISKRYNQIKDHLDLDAMQTII